MGRLARLLTLVGTVVAVVGLGKLHAVRHAYDYTGSTRFAWSIAYVAFLWLTSYGTGIPDVLQGRRRVLVTVWVAPLLAAVGMSVLQLVVGDALLPRFVVFTSVLLLAPWYLLCVALASGGRSLAEERDRVFVIASHQETSGLRLDLQRRPERPAQLVDGVALADAIEIPSPELRARIAACRTTVLVLSREAQADERLVHLAAELHEGGLRVRTLALFHEQWLGKLPVSELERTSLMFDIREVHRSVYGRLSRVLDLIGGVVGIVPLLVVIPFVLVGNLAANRGPLFYRQPRVGKNGSVFQIVKFRTMRPEGGRLLNEWTVESDPRITPFGRLLRVTHLDELPQVTNILRGELSLVGPRPEQPHYVQELVDKIPFYDLRHLVRPGLTGWAQVKYGYAGSESDALEKLQYEFFYLRHQGLLFDLRILGRTVRSVLGRRGR